MDAVLILFFLMGFLLMIGIPIGTSYLVYRFIKKKNYSRKTSLIALTPILIISFLIFRALYPSDDFYKEDFKEVTGVSFPVNGEIKYKTSSFPDHFGDYASVSLVKIDKKLYKELPEKLIKKGLSENQDRISSSELDKILAKVKDNVIEREFSCVMGGGIYYYVGFLSDKETLIVKRLSW